MGITTSIHNVDWSSDFLQILLKLFKKAQTSKTRCITMADFMDFNITEFNIFYTDSANWLDNYNYTYADDYHGTEFSYSDRPGLILGIVLCAITILANVASLVALCSLRQGSSNRGLIISLCFSDVFTALSVVGMEIENAHFNPLYSYGEPGYPSKICMHMILKGLQISAHIISLFNLLGLAFDHYIKILKPMKYQTLMSRKRMRSMLVFFWTSAFILGFSDFWIATISTYHFCNEKCDPIVNYCDRVFCSRYEPEYIMFAVTFLCIIVMTYIYILIFIRIRRYHIFTRENSNNTARNQRGLVTTFLIVATFVVCWLPYLLFTITMLIKMYSTIDMAPILEVYKIFKNNEFYIFDIVLVNSICDPILYAVRMKDIRNQYKTLLHKIGICSPSHLNSSSLKLSSKSLVKDGSVNMSKLSSHKSKTNRTVTTCNEHVPLA
ncbi:unnamed protein product [Owenia fusiformis]|uniref:Uncharacterized protein n=1 Tax=Owenia fusiformis TaxID=6347 RepID=A0A8J1TTL6_OWEFU|nr:unnamed protein product [Owenia fusiformis]